MMAAILDFLSKGLQNSFGQNVDSVWNTHFHLVYSYKNYFRDEGKFI